MNRPTRRDYFARKSETRKAFDSLFSPSNPKFNPLHACKIAWPEHLGFFLRAYARREQHTVIWWHHLHPRFVETFIFLTLILVAWEIWHRNLILRQILIYSKKNDQKRIIRHDFAKTFSKSAPKNPIFKTPFFSIIERFQRFPKNFLLTKFFEMCLCVVQIWRRTYPPRGPLGFHFPPLIYEDFTSSKVKSCRVVKSLWAGFHKKYWKKWNSPERGAYDAKFERHITKYGWKQLKMSWFYVISYNLGLCRLVKRSKAASKTGQILLKNTNIGIKTPCKRAVHTEIWNIWEIDCFFRPKPCNDLFI